MKEMTARIKNRDGIHCRPSSMIMSAAQDYPDHSIEVSSANGDTDLGSILGLLSLALQSGETATIRVSGPREDEVCQRMVELFQTNFDFPHE